MRGEIQVQQPPARKNAEGAGAPANEDQPVDVNDPQSEEDYEQEYNDPRIDGLLAAMPRLPHAAGPRQSMPDDDESDEEDEADFMRQRTAHRPMAGLPSGAANGRGAAAGAGRGKGRANPAAGPGRRVAS